MITRARGGQTELLAPITEVVHADHIPTRSLVQVREETTNDCAAEMASVEGLSDVGGRELDDDALALAGVHRSVVLLAGENVVEDNFGEKVGLEEEGEEGAGDRGLLAVGVLGELDTMY